MMRHSLPNYDKYLKRLELFAKTLGVKVQHTEEAGEGSFSPHSRRIRLDVDLSPAEEIATFLHELGHAVDDMLIDDKIWKSVDQAYGMVYGGKLSKKKRALVLNCEKRAWQYGRSIAKQLHIRLGRWYSETETRCLRAYCD